MIVPLLYTDDVEALAQWLVTHLDLRLYWQSTGAGESIDHAELRLGEQYLSLNRRRTPYDEVGPTVLGLRYGDRETVERLYARALDWGLPIAMALTESSVAWSFTVADPDGNHWWVHAETGMLDELRPD
ncbi:MAG: VOC family protein [Pseudomonadota bacterium]